jgi:hypothetical protein
VILAGIAATITLIPDSLPHIAAPKNALFIATLAVSQWICEMRVGLSLDLFADAGEGKTNAGNKGVKRTW